MDTRTIGSVDRPGFRSPVDIAKEIFSAAAGIRIELAVWLKH